jgi:NAD kinase
LLLAKLGDMVCHSLIDIDVLGSLGREITGALDAKVDDLVGFGLREGDVIEVKKSNAKLRFIRSPFRDYFTVLRTKLKWGER